MNSDSFPKKAMLLAAGLGERMRPLTLEIPKPLLPVNGKSLIEYNIELLVNAGIQGIVINLYHLGEKIRKQIGSGEKWGIQIHYSEEKEILGTGGGLKQAESFFKNEFLFLMNSDLLIQIDLKKVFDFHLQHQAEATLVVTQADRPDVGRFVFWNKEFQVKGIASSSPELHLLQSVFTGVQILHSDLIQYLPLHQKACLIQDGYLPMLKDDRRIFAYPFEGYWRDVGTFERYQQVQSEVEESNRPRQVFKKNE